MRAYSFLGGVFLTLACESVAHALWTHTEAGGVIGVLLGVFAAACLMAARHEQD